MNNLWIIAAAGDGVGDSGEGEVISSGSVDGQTEEVIAVDSPNGGGEQPQTKSSPTMMTYLPLVAIFVLMWFMLFRGPKKKQQKHQQMVKSMQKNDRVRTIGGIIGTVIEVRDEEITLKIDESNNTKIKVIAGAIQTILSKDSD